MLHTAFAERLQFGRDMVIMFGPWGFLYGGGHPATQAILAIVFWWTRDLNCPVTALLHVKLPRVSKASVIKSIQIEEDRFGVEPEIIAKLARTGCRIYEVGVPYSGRTYAEGKKINWKDGIRAIYPIFKYNLGRRRV